MGVSRRTASVSANKNNIVPLCVLVNIPGKKKSLNKRFVETSAFAKILFFWAVLLCGGRRGKCRGGGVVGFGPPLPFPAGGGGGWREGTFRKPQKKKQGERPPPVWGGGNHLFPRTVKLSCDIVNIS